MSNIERALAILEFLEKRRGPDGLIQMISNAHLMQEMGAPSSHGVAFGQANSLLDIASLEARVPLIGCLVIFDRGEQCQGTWANWEMAMPFLSLAPRFKVWTDEDFKRLREAVSERPGNPELIWKKLGERSEDLLRTSVKIAEDVFTTYANRVLSYN